jgi:outer membrane lipoprotein
MTFAARIAIPLIAASALAACATPAPLKGTYAPITPEQAGASDATGTLVRWGGRIVSVDPQAQRTCFEMISTRLQVDGQPRRASDETGGRFIACRAGFYDPALFEKNREVTFTGRIEGYETRKIGGYDYRFPKVAADVVYLWPERERADVIAAPYPYWGWGWGSRSGWSMGWGWRFGHRW